MAPANILNHEVMEALLTDSATGDVYLKSSNTFISEESLELYNAVVFAGAVFRTKGAVNYLLVQSMLQIVELYHKRRYYVHPAGENGYRRCRCLVDKESRNM